MKKIMFNDKYGLTRAVLEGRKTQTRRIPTDRVFQRCRSLAFCEEGFTPYWEKRFAELLFLNAQYCVGEEVAVAQSYKSVADEDHNFCIPNAKGFFNKGFVLADLMPHRIKITNISVERLQDISDEDCLKEGIYVDDNAPEGVPLKKYIPYSYDADTSRQKRRWWFGTPREAFAVLIDKTCGKGTWESNPWVFVYDFQLIR